MTSDEPAELTPEEEEALYTKLFGPDAPKPTSQPHKHMTTFRDGKRVVEREDRPDRSAMFAVEPEHRRAVVVCRNVKGRPTTLAVVVTNPGDDFGMVFDSNLGNVSLGQDFPVDCRCGIAHQVDGGRLRSAVLALPRRRGSKPPTVNIWDVERRASE